MSFNTVDFVSIRGRHYPIQQIGLNQSGRTTENVVVPGSGHRAIILSIVLAGTTSRPLTLSDGTTDFSLRVTSNNMLWVASPFAIFAGAANAAVTITSEDNLGNTDVFVRYIVVPNLE